MAKIRKQVFLRLEHLETRDLPSVIPAPPANVGTPVDVRAYYGVDRIQFADPAQAGSFIAGDGSGQTIGILLTGAGNGAKYLIGSVSGSGTPGPSYSYTSNAASYVGTDYRTNGSDLYWFSQQFSLPQFGDYAAPAQQPASNATPWLLVVGSDGTTNTFHQNNRLTACDANVDVGEIMQDVEYAHAIAPRANIIMMVADSFQNGFQTLIALGANVISVSQAGQESSPTPSQLDPYLQTPNVTVLFAAGDNGAGYQYQGNGQYEYWYMGAPAHDPNVIAVGGTNLSYAELIGLNPETAWGNGVNSQYKSDNTSGPGGGGGGYSIYETASTYQQSFLSSRSSTFPTPDLATYLQNQLPSGYQPQAGDAAPAVPQNPRYGPDVAMLAEKPIVGFNRSKNYDCQTDTPKVDPWTSEVDGTSLATPMWAALIAIANQGRELHDLQPLTGYNETIPLLYSAPESLFNDISTGNSGYPAGPGFDLATGRGSPKADLLIPYLALFESNSIGTFFLDGNNQLWVNDAGGMTNTGGYGASLSAGLDASGLAEAYFRDGVNQLWRYDQGAFTNTGGYATAIFAGQEEVFFLDGNNQIYVYQDTGAFIATGGYAQSLRVGQDDLGNDEVWFRDGMNQIWRYSQGAFFNTGGFGIELVAGRQGQVWFRDGNYQVWIYRDGVGFINTGAYALSLGSWGCDLIGNDELSFLDGNHQVWKLNYLGQFTNTGGFAASVQGGVAGETFFLDGNNQLWVYTDGAGLTGTGGYGTTFGVTHGAPFGNSKVFFLNDGGLFSYDQGNFLFTGAFARLLEPFVL